MKLGKSDLSTIPQSSAWYIAAHSEWRNKRKKKRPSAIYPVIRNPYLARDIARAIVKGLILRDQEYAYGQQYLESGKVHKNSSNDELRAIVRFTIEDSSSLYVAQNRLLYMVDVPLSSIINLWTCPLDEFVHTVQHEAEGLNKIEALLSSAICSGENKILFTEAARSRGQLFLRNGDPVTIDIRTRGREIISM